jgi:hypothetical protein
LALSAAFAPAGNAKRYEDIMDNGAAIAMILLVLPHLMSWLSLARLNGGRPGFPLYLHYTRPVRTAVIVGLPMAYLTAVSSAIYLVSALLLMVASGYAFPLLPVAAWIAALSLIGLAATWSTRDRTVQVLVMVFAIMRAFGVAVDRLTAVDIPDTFDWPPRLWPTLFDFPLTDYAWIALIGLASFGVTVAGVTRQRRGDGWLRLVGPRIVGPARQLFRFRVHIVATRACMVGPQVQRIAGGDDRRGAGDRDSAAVGGQQSIDAAIYEWLRADRSCSERDALRRGCPVRCSPLIVLCWGKCLRDLPKQGRSMSVFEATQAHGTAHWRLKPRKSACVLALITVGVAHGHRCHS